MDLKRKAPENTTLPLRSPRKPTVKPYVYDTILPGEMRILVLSPGQQGEPLGGALEVVDRKEQPKYKAISYAWGDAIFSHTLQLPGGRLLITESLSGALTCFRNETEPVRLWADAVCINQDGIQEKNHQVAYMHEIFEEAEEVLVWLGESQPSDCLAYYLLDKLASLPRLLKLWDIPDEVAEAHEQLLHSSVDYLGWVTCVQCGTRFEISGGHTLSEALRAFCRRPWFSRLWVIQELFCAQKYKMYFGRHVALRSIVKGAFYNHTDYPGFGITKDLRSDREFKWGTLSWHSSLDIISSNLNSQHLIELVDTIFSTQRAICSVPHDRVFAIQRMAMGDNTHLIPPDYGLPIKDLWGRVATIELTRRSYWNLNSNVVRPSPIQVLALAGVQRKWDSADEPSWVPDLGNLTDECLRKHTWYEHMSVENRAGGHSYINASVNSTIHLLEIGSLSIGIVESICMDTQYPAMLHEEDTFRGAKDAFWNQVEHTVFPWFMKCAELASSRANLDISHGISLLRLMFHDDNATPETWLNEYPISILAIRAFERWQETTHRVVRSTIDPAFVKKVFNMLLTRTNYFSTDIDGTRVLASTSAGHIGWIPEGSEPGDVVMLLQGSPFPFILRRRPDGYYSVIGDAYIQGVMQGEAWPEDDNTGVEQIGIK